MSTVVAQLYAQAGGGHLDGVAVDPEALASLLSLSGPVHVPGFGQLDASNAANLLLKGQYALYPDPHSKACGGTSSKRPYAGPFNDCPPDRCPSRSPASALDPVVRQGRLLLWSFHPADQPLLRRLGLDGAFPARRGGDLLSVVTQNAAANKIDVYLQDRSPIESAMTRETAGSTPPLRSVCTTRLRQPAYPAR